MKPRQYVYNFVVIPFAVIYVAVALIIGVMVDAVDYLTSKKEK